MNRTRIRPAFQPMRVLPVPFAALQEAVRGAVGSESQQRPAHCSVAASGLTCSGVDTSTSQSLPSPAGTTSSSSESAVPVRGCEDDQVDVTVGRRLAAPPRGVFGDQVAAAAMIDRIVHHGDVLTFERSQLPVPKQGLDWRSRHRRVVSGPARGGGVLSVDEKSQVHWPNPNRRFR